MTDYTKEAQMLAEQYARNFHGPTYSLDDDASFSLDEAAKLIALSKIERQHILQTIANQEQSQEALTQAREDISLLPDREAEKVRHNWLEQASAQASRYCQSRNAGASPKSFDPNDKEQADIRSGVISWIKKQKMRGNFGGQKTLDKN